MVKIRKRLVCEVYTKDNVGLIHRFKEKCVREKVSMSERMIGFIKADLNRQVN